MASYTTLIDALNAIAVAAGGSGGHKFLIDALNDWSVAQSGTGGHRYTIDALNEIAGLYGAAGGHKFDHLALNAISTALSGVAGHVRYLDALNEIVDLPALGGGGGEEYVAPAVTLSAGASVERGDFLTDVVDGPTGFISFYVRPDDESIGIDFARTANGNFEARFEGPTGQFQSNYYDNSGDNSLEVRGNEPEPLFSWGEWNHVLLAWDVAYVTGSRRLAVYVNDIKIDTPASFDSGDADFNIDYTNNNFLVLMPFGTGIAPLDYADFGLWFNSNIIEADSTISEVNRRKFISAAGKPVDPSNWPANPVIKFSGDEEAFLTNQGSGGAFTLISGTIQDAATSPSG